MTGQRWTAFLQTAPRDVGCAEAMDLLHVYAELTAADAAAAERYPGIAAHLRAAVRAARTLTGCWRLCAAAADDRAGSPAARRIQTVMLPVTLASRLAMAGQR